MRDLKLNLSQKGMLLIAVPITLQLLFLLSYGRMLQQAESTARLQFASKEIFNYSDWLGVLILGSALSSVDYQLTGDNKAKKDCDAYKKEIPLELKRLGLAVSENGGDRVRFEKLKQLTNSTLALLDSQNSSSSHDPNATPDAPIQNLKLPELWQSWTNVTQERHALITDYKQKHALRPEDLLQVQEMYRVMVSLGVILTVFMAFVLFWGFSQGVTRRLGVLTENAARLSRRQELNPPVSGHDEISHLDEVFHATAAALLMAEQQKQEFVDMISHDLKTPLSALQGVLALVSQGVYGQLSSSGKERVEYAEHDVNRLIRLINGLLDVEKMTAGMLELNTKPLQLATVISEAVESVRPVADQASVTISVQSGNLALTADRERLVQVLINLLSNAIKYSPEGKSVLIATESLEGVVKVSVQDQGCGIAQTDQQRIFDRFQQVKSSEKRDGTGLGLAICKAIIDAHGGRIGVQSTPGIGSTFWFELPATNTN